MEKIKFDFEATKERIYAPNSNVPIGAPVDQNGNIANDGNAYGIVLCKETENEKYWVKYNLVVMVAGYCDIIDAQAIWGDEYSAGAKAAMSNITFCNNHELPTGGGGGGGMFVINYDTDEEGSPIVDKQFSEIYEAVDVGAQICVVNRWGDLYQFFDYDDDYVTFSRLVKREDGTDYVTLRNGFLTINDDGSVTERYETYKINCVIEKYDS